jgi:hypothetical protein
MTASYPRRLESSVAWHCEELEWWTGKDVDGGGHNLIWGTVPAFTGGLRKTMKTFCQDSWSVGWDVNLSPEYESDVLTLGCIP